MGTSARGRGKLQALSGTEQWTYSAWQALRACRHDCGPVCGLGKLNPQAVGSELRADSPV